MNTVKVADEVWIATALLHTDNPDREEFSVGEIVSRAVEVGLHKPLRPGVMIHASQHCVANKVPNPGTYRMLYATDSGKRRLFRNGDPVALGRKGKIAPAPESIPAEYTFLLDWYYNHYNPAAKAEAADTGTARYPTANATQIQPSNEESNMSNMQKVLRFVERNPGHDDDEISSFTGIRPRQQVNIILRALEAAGKVRRDKRPGYKIRNYPT